MLARPMRWLAIWAMAQLLLVNPAARGVAAPEKAQAVLLYDGKLPEQAALESATRSALAPYAERVVLRSVHAGRADAGPFLRLHQLTRKDAPLLLVMSSAGTQARVLRRVPLTADATVDDNVRGLLAGLRLPVPRAAPTALAPGTTIVVLTDGSMAEKPYLVQATSGALAAEGSRKLHGGAVVVYRFPAPSGVRDAELRAEIGGAYLVEWADNVQGPWSALMDSGRYFGQALDLIRQRTQPVANMKAVLARLPGDLFIRVRSRAASENPAEVTRLEFAVLPPGTAGGEADWLARAEALRREGLAAVLPPGEIATPLTGTLARDLVLEAERSPYLLSGELSVPTGLRLTVEPGVLVRVIGNAVIRVQGRLVARGTAFLPITFVPVKPSRSDDWRGIQFQPLPNAPSGERSVVSFCRIVNAESLELPRFSGEISHSILENSTRGLVLRSGGTGQIHHNRFLRCRQGLTVDSGGGEVTANEWIGCMTALVVQAPPTGATLRVEENSFRDSRLAAVQVLRRPVSSAPGLTLARNHWSGTPADRLVATGVDSMPVTVEPRLESVPQGVGPGW